MRRIQLSLNFLFLVAALVACGGSANKQVHTEEIASTAKNNVPEYVELNNPQVDILKFAKDKDGYITIFDGRTFEGWRGYGMSEMPSTWMIDKGSLRVNGAQDIGPRTDIIFAHKFKNFELVVDWKIAKGGNSGIMYLAREIESINPETGEKTLEGTALSAPEAQLLDDVNSSYITEKTTNMSLYDMIAAKPDATKPYGEWNTAKITIRDGKVTHHLNGMDVLSYELWTPEWTALLQQSKFSETNWPMAFELLNNCGGKDRSGYISLQDHGNDVWFKNIKVKILD